jgi:hypothetical protein
MGESIKQSYGYNYIQDIGPGWVLWKNADLQPAGSFMIKNALIEFGYDPSQHKVKIRRMGYSKGDYSEADIKRIADLTYNCPFCKIGKPLQNINLNNKELISYINTNYTKRDDKNMVTLTDFLDPLTAYAKIPPEFNERVFPQLYSRLLNLGISLGIPNDVVRYLAVNLGGGLAGLLINEFFNTEGRLKNELRVFFGNFVTSAIPNLNIEKLTKDVIELMQVGRYGGPIDVFKAIFQSPIEQIQAAVRDITRAIGLGGGAPPMFQAPGQIRGTRKPEFPIPFGQQVASTGFKLPERSPLLRPGLPPQSTSDVQFLENGQRVGGFRVTETLKRY